MGSKPHNIAGIRFGKLTAVNPVPKEPSRSTAPTKWVCVCDCGGKCTPTISNLKNSNTTSCGCVQRERAIAAKTTHGMAGSRLYNSWTNMKARCQNPKTPSFVHYGARGIKICAEWQQFSAFQEWALEKGFRPELSLERINVNEGYEPSNCTWATDKEQVRNRRTTPRRVDGTPWVDVAEQNGISARLYSSRVCHGWSHYDAATKPKRVWPIDECPRAAQAS